MSARGWALAGVGAGTLAFAGFVVAGAGIAWALPPLMIVAASATVVAGAIAGGVAGGVGALAALAARGIGPSEGYLVAVVAVTVIFTDRLAATIRRSRARADRSLALLSVLISALHRVAEAPGARDAEATLPGLLDGHAGGGLLVWRTSYGEPEAVAGAADAEEMEAVAAAVRRVVQEKAELDGPQRTPRGRFHLTAVPVFERGDVVAVFTALRRTAMAPPERSVVREFTATLGHVLTRLHEERSGDLVLQLAQKSVAGSSTAPMAQGLLDLVLPELGLWGGAVMRYGAGRFRAEALAGTVPEGLADRLRRGLVYGEGLVWEAYRGGAPLFIEDYAAHPAASSELVAFGVGSVAVVPVAQARSSPVLVTLFHRRPRPWLASERSLLADLVTVLRASLAQRESELRLSEMARLQRELLATPVSEMYRRLLEAATRLVPGAEAASLLVRGPDGLFRYAAVVGFDRDGLSSIRFTLEAMETWYGRGNPGWPRGEPRVLVSRPERSVAAISALTEPNPQLRRAGRVDEIVADLCLPVLYRGEVLAILNLDAMHDPDAFGEAAIAAASGLAPFVGFLLHEADARERLASAARTDELTGLANRRAFNEQAERELTRSVRYGEPLGLLILDLSRFKQVNDRFGHAAGDDALKAVAEALRSAARGGDRLYRWGGDEFAALLTHADAEAARRAATRMAAAIAAVETPAGTLGVNIGVACAPSDGGDVDGLVRVADDRMFRAKASGSVMVEAD